MSNEKVLKNQLLIESSEFSAKIKLSKALKESVKLSQGKAGTLIVRNVPCTILNRRNQNGRIYPTDVMEKAIKEARFAIETKQLLSKPNEHPDSSFVAPSEASHVIIDAYIKKNVSIVVEGKKERQDVLFMDWEVLNTQNGKDLRALLEAECSIGTSIRGVGDLVGDTVDNYQLLGVDIVGNPSSSTYTRMPVAESVKVEFANEKSLKEGFTVTSSSTDVARDIESAGLLANKLDKADFATISNTSTKLEHDIDPKTGAQTTLVTFEADTSDDVTDLNQALAMAQRILTNPYSHVDSVTIENIDEEDETTGGSKKESVEDKSEMEEGIVGGVLGGVAGGVLGNAVAGPLGALGGAASGYNLGSNIGDDLSDDDDKKESVVKKAKNKSEEYIPESEMEEGIDGSILGGAAGATVGHPILGAAAGSMIQDKFFNGDKKESAMKEAKEEKDPKDGRKYVLKAPNGFVGMDGNALVFKDDPAEALHFISGKEESGLVHLSGVEKILDTMGVYDIEKYYRKPENEISNKNTADTDELNEVGDINVSTGDVLSGNDVDVPLVGKESCSEKLTEDNGYDTKYVAEVHINKDGAMESTDTVPVSSTELQSALSEVSNLWNMKTQKGEGQVTLFLLDTTTGEKYKYNNESNTLEPATEVKESALTEEDSVKQNGNQLTVDLGGDHGSVTKDFEDNAQASVVKAGLEQGKIAGNVMLEGDGILDGWYVANEKIGITGPFKSKEEAENEFKDFLDNITIEYLSNDESGDEQEEINEDTNPQIQAGWYAEIDGKVFGPAKSEDEAKSKIDPKILHMAKIHYVSPQDAQNITESTLTEGLGGAIVGGLGGALIGHPILGAAAGSLIQDKFRKGKGWKAGAILGGAAGSMVGMPFVGATAGALLQNMWKGKKESVNEAEDGNIQSGWYAGSEGIGVVGPFDSKENAEEYFKDFLDRVSIEYLSSDDEKSEDELNEKLFDKQSDPSDDFVEKPINEDEKLDEGIFTGIDRLKDMGRSAKKGFNNYLNSDYTANNIFNAVEKDGLNYLKRAVSRNVDFSKMKDASGRTPLITAIDGNKEDIVELFANDKRLINSPDNAGYTPIMHAIKQQNPNTINILLSHGANLGPNSKGISPVDYAQQFNDQTALSTLLDYFDANGKNPFEQQNQRTMNQNRINTYKSASNTKANNQKVNTSNAQSNVSNNGANVNTNTNIDNNANLNKIETALEAGKQAIKAMLPYVNDSSALYLGLAASEGNEEIKELINSELKSRASKLAAKKKA